MNKPYRVNYGWCREDWQDFATFDEALAFFQTNPGGKWGESICNTDGVDITGDADEDGHYRMSDGLTEEEREAML